MRVAVLTAVVPHEDRQRGPPGRFGEGHRGQGVRTGPAVEHLGVNDPLVRDDLAVLAVEGDLSSVGSVTLAVLLVVTAAISSLWLLELVQDDVQLAEPLGPRAFVVPNPVVDRLERASVQPVEPLASLVTDLDRSDRSEHP
jgi:hypothetical protein